MNNKIFIVSAFAVCIASFMFYNKLDVIEKGVERVEVESIISSGKAIYMPGNVCILKATSEINTAKMREFAAACIQSHDRWLLINNGKTNYSNADTAIQE
tara:strand:- start:261 stop:560 length:300 start_codon:yes stop_codon:yes gene_type:complete